jgi:uncharacterized protein YceH (UPF0502 family)
MPQGEIVQATLEYLRKAFREDFMNLPSESPNPSPTTPPTWPELSPAERRILGVLVEKAKTTPDAYPLSVNALVTGCNQKSNREPLMNLSDLDVEDILAELQKKGLAIKITGGRVIRWRHALYEAWHADKVELAILAELLLRGPQTEGELRARASRMEPIDDLDALRAVLRPLQDRRLVVYLTPTERRGTVLTHGFHGTDELERLKAHHGAEGAEDTAEAAPTPRPAPTPASPAPGLTAVQAEVAALKESLAELEARVAGLAEEVRRLKEGLGG